MPKTTEEIIENLKEKRFTTNYCMKPKPVVILDDALEALTTLQKQHEQELREQKEEYEKELNQAIGAYGDLLSRQQD